MASGPIISWLIDGEKVKTVTDFSLGSKITADGDYSHNIKRCLLLGEKALRKVKGKVHVAQSCLTLCDPMDYTVCGFSRPAMRHLDSILKRWDITLPTKAHIVKAVVWCWSWSSNSLTTWYEEQKLIGKDRDGGKHWGQEEKGMREDETAGWHHRLSGHELSKLHETVKDREASSASVHGVTKSWTQLSDWTKQLPKKSTLIC